MNLIRIVTLILCFSLLLYSCKEHKFKPKNDNLLILSDSLIIAIDSLTLSNSNSISYKDSILKIPNEGANSLTIYNIISHKTNYFNFDLLPNKIVANSCWYQNNDSIFIFDKKENKIYLTNSNYKIIDSFKTLYNSNLIGPSIILSTSQMPHYFNNKIYYSGISIGENFVEKNRYTIGEIGDTSITYYVNYPDDYKNKNLGGIYYRITYHTVSNDSLLNISFPASNQIAIFNIKTKKVIYKTLYPDISSSIIPFNNNNKLEILSQNDSKIATHFYGQFSFKEIIYDPFRNVFYRVLKFPGSKSDLSKNKFGKQTSYILVYSSNYKYLGCGKIDLNTETSKFFVTKKGLYLQKLIKDENSLFFYLYTINSNVLQL